jgi:hypothetical protein
MNDININCDFDQSVLNPDLYVCRRCGTVVHKTSLHFSAICPVLLDQVAMDPKYPQIKLSKIETTNTTSQEIKELPIPEKAKEISDDWWKGTLDIIHVQPLKKPEPLLNRPPQTTNPLKQQCSEEQINERMNICQGCEFFQDNTCLQCGCALSRDRVYMNKLLWSDQSCPIGKWGPVTTS